MVLVGKETAIWPKCACTKSNAEKPRSRKCLWSMLSYNYICYLYLLYVVLWYAHTHTHTTFKCLVWSTAATWLECNSRAFKLRQVFGVSENAPHRTILLLYVSTSSSSSLCHKLWAKLQFLPGFTCLVVVVWTEHPNIYTQDWHTGILMMYARTQSRQYTNVERVDLPLHSRPRRCH